MVEAQPWARFDDLRTGSAYCFPSAYEVLVAHRPDEVIPVLHAVDRATEGGRWAYGFVSYEAAGAFDPRLVVHAPSPGSPPLAWFAVTGPAVAIAPLAGAAADDPLSEAADEDLRWSPTWTEQQHQHDVKRVQAHIERGDTYQCNLTVRMRGGAPSHPLEFYRQLALGQRGAYNAYLDLGRFVIASASPELFFERIGDELVLRPMKGTAARGRTLAEDRVRADLLRSSVKERAENVMIVDLIRNDAARVAQVGTVAVRELCAVERYETVLQLTSTVAAQLRPGVGLPELFGTLFPSGSVTGAPKVSTMALIRELEATPRGVYCGAIGFVAPPDAGVRARFNVAIRTAVIDRDTASAEYGVGGGITWSSDPEAEHREVVVKTAVLHRRHCEFELIETLRFDPELGLRNLDRHLERMAASAEYFGFRFDKVSALRQLDLPWSATDSARVRFRLRRDGQFAIEVFALEHSDDPVRLVVDDAPVDSTSPRLRHKTSQRQPYDQRRHRHPEADDVILVNERGELTETSRANLVLQLGGQWWTPPLESGCLPGVERGRLLELGMVAERVLSRADLHQAEELAVLSSLRGWRPAVLG